MVIFPCLIFSIFAIIFSQLEFSADFLITFSTLACALCLFPYFSRINGLLLKPSIIYSLSVMIFIMARPIINIFYNIDVISVGNSINDSNILKVISIILFSLSITSISYLSTKLKPSFFYRRNFIFKRISIIKAILYYLFIFFGIVFLYSSYIKSKTIGELSYFDITNDISHFDHLKFFFIGKIICLLWLLSSGDKYSDFLKGSVLLFIFSFGFLIIGLRGYFISYLFLYLFLLNLKFKFKYLYLIAGCLVLLIGSSYILEYRLGYSVYNNLLEMIIMPFYQQGATFEVVFGSVIFSSELNNCLSLFDYIFKIIPFGVCVDRVRGVPFDDGGFASSFFAESYYLGFFIYTIFSILIGFFLKFLDEISFYVKNNIIDQHLSPLLFILFLVIPNLVYFGRSSAFDFILKFLEGIIFISIFFKKTSK